MAEKRDAELYINKLVELLKAQLNPKINEINIKKDDGITLRQIENNAYYYLSFGQSVPAYDPCVVLGVESDITGEIGGLSSETLRIVIEIVTSSRAELETLKLVDLLQRYRRALMEIGVENHRKFPAMSIVGLPDVAFTLDDGMYYAVGVGITMNYPI